jgi:hypothetical protein
MGPRRSTVVLVESRVDADGPDEIFAGVDTALVTLTRSLPEGGREEVAELLAEYRAAIAEANEVLDVIEPWRAVPPLWAGPWELCGGYWMLSGGAGRLVSLGMSPQS